MDLTVPFLRKGIGHTPKQGGCIMQVVDWMNRHEWTDRPPCVHPFIRDVALMANDFLDNKDRQSLLSLASTLSDTRSDDISVDIDLCRFADIYASDNHLGSYYCRSNVVKCKIREMLELQDALCDPRYIRAKGLDVIEHVCQTIALDIGGGGMFAFLVAILDEYDRLTGRNVDELEEIDWASVCEVMAHAT